MNVVHQYEFKRQYHFELQSSQTRNEPVPSDSGKVPLATADCGRVRLAGLFCHRSDQIGAPNPETTNCEARETL